MSSGAQEILDRAFGVTPEIRARLGRLEIPRPVLRAQRAVHLSFPRGFAPACFLFLVALVAASSFAPRAALVACAGAPMLAFWLGLRRARWTTSWHLRIVEGSVRTTRCWNYGYGDTYHLVAELEVQPDGQGAPEREFFDVYSKLGEHALSGRVRLFVARIPTKIGELGAIETVLAIEALEDTRLVVRGPARPPPEEPYLGGVPAD